MLSTTGWMLVATGFTGAMTLRFALGLLGKKLGLGATTKVHLARVLLGRALQAMRGA